VVSEASEGELGEAGRTEGREVHQGRTEPGEQTEEAAAGRSAGVLVAAQVAEVA